MKARKKKTLEKRMDFGNGDRTVRRDRHAANPVFEPLTLQSVISLADLSSFGKAVGRHHHRNTRIEKKGSLPLITSTAIHPTRATLLEKVSHPISSYHIESDHPLVYTPVSQLCQCKTRKSPRQSVSIRRATSDQISSESALSFVDSAAAIIDQQYTFS